MLSKIEKQIQREDVIHAIGSSGIDKLVEVPDFCQDLWLPAIPDPGKSSVLVKPLPRAPIRRIQMHEHLIPRHETCRRMKREGPVELEKLTKPPAGIVSIFLPALFKSGSAGESPQQGRP